MEQWLRYFKLYVSTDGSNKEAIDLSDYRVKFKISQAIVGKPCTAEITVYNVSTSTVNQIGLKTNSISNKKIKVIIEAGYQENHSVIFQGDLWWKSEGRESTTDTFMRLVAATGDRSHQYAVVNLSIPKGASQEEVFNAVMGTMSNYDVTVDKKPSLMDAKLPRGKVMFSMSADAMSKIADTNNFLWAYGTNGFVAIRKDATKEASEQVTVVNVSTGMINRPTLTPDGVEVQALLLPHIDVGSIIQIDNSSIQRSSYNTEVSTGALSSNLAVTNDMISADGLYRVLAREHVGDTRGNEWYTTMICSGVNASQQPMTTTSINNIPNM